MKMHIKKGDKVFILSGKDKGMQGEVLASYPKEGKVIVEGVNIVTKHKKPSQQMQQGGIIHQEAPINASKCMLICPNCKRPVKVAKKVLESGDKIRTCRHCNEAIDTISTAAK